MQLSSKVESRIPGEVSTAEEAARILLLWYK